MQGCSNNSSIFSKDNIPLVHRIDIQQGNVITQDMLAKLKLGMEKKKVRYIMGTPIIIDTFNNDRWDYIYTYQNGREQREQRRVTLFFKDDRLVRIDGDVRPAHGKILSETRKVESVEVPPGESPGLFGKLKEKLSFGKDKPKVVKKTEGITTQEPNPSGDVIAPKEASASSRSMLKTETEQSSKEAVKTDEKPAEEEESFFGKLWDKLGNEEKEQVEPELNTDPSMIDPVDPSVPTGP